MLRPKGLTINIPLGGLANPDRSRSLLYTIDDTQVYSLGPGPDISGVNLRIPDDLSQIRVANHFAVVPSVRGVPLMHGWMELIKPHPTM